MAENSDRHHWQPSEVKSLFEQSFMDLLFQAQTVHRANFDQNKVQLSTLMSIKTGTCPEDCGYCSQSGHHSTDLERQKLLPLADVIKQATAAKEAGATRFCMGAAWRSPPKKDFPAVIEMVKAVKALGLETCLTAGMLNEAQAQSLKEAGLAYYNHNLDTSPEYYKEVISTRTYDDRLKTLDQVRAQGIKVCCGGILGMGEQAVDRFSLLCELANLPEYPQSVPINRLVPIPGTPLADAAPIDDFDFVRTIACARIMMPKAMVRLSAGRETMNASLQALCFQAGANSIFYGDALLTTSNSPAQQDQALLKRLGMYAAEAVVDEQPQRCCQDERVVDAA